MSEIIFSGNLLWPDGKIRAGDVSVIRDKISRLAEPDEQQTNQDNSDKPAVRIQVPEGHVIAPGYIDLLINGAFGHDFTSNPRQIAAVARNLPRFGITAFLPTLISAPLAQYSTAARLFKEIKHEGEMAAVLGLHIEGPYLNRAKAGSHSIAYLRQPDIDELSYFDPESVRYMTVSPELPGALPFIRAIRERGISVGLGHSTATFEEALAAADAGASWASHLYNGMGTMHHRFPGLVGAMLTDERLSIGLVADLVHLHAAVLKLVVAAKKPGQITLISNAVSAAGMPLGKYTLGNQTVESSSVGIRLPNGTLAGGLEMLDQGVRNMVNQAGRPLAEALQMACQTPAELLGLKTKGKLAPNYDADIIILDEQLQVTLTMVRGKVVYEHTGQP